MKPYDCAIIISSCDAYSDVWEPFFRLFFKYWPDCPFPIYLISETKTYKDERVHPILLGKDEQWATNIRKALNQILISQFIYLQEDYLLMKKVDTDRIVRLIQTLKDNNIGYIRLYPSPAPKTKWSVDSSLGVISKSDDYSICLQATLWNKDLFTKLLINGESAWDMEIKGSKRIQSIPEVFLSVLKGQPAINYFCTAIKKGVWFRDAVALIRREGIPFTSTRRVESFGNYLLRKSHLKKYVDMTRRVSQRK